MERTEVDKSSAGVDRYSWIDVLSEKHSKLLSHFTRGFITIIALFSAAFPLYPNTMLESTLSQVILCWEVSEHHLG